MSGLNATASAASDCLDNPDLRVTEPGHWFFHLDRTLNRRCWHFEPAQVAATTSAPTPIAPPAPANNDTPQALLARIAPALFSPTQQQQPVPQQPNPVAETPAEPAQTAVAPKQPRRNSKTARQERSQTDPLPTTTGAATAERQDQPPSVVPAEKSDRRDPPINVADREALFQDFMKWQMERSLFGRP